MTRQLWIEDTEKSMLKESIPAFRIGDTLKVAFKIIEGGKERIQSLTGTVIARKGRGAQETVTLYRIAYGSAMEKVFFLHSPRVTDIEITRQGKARRSKLYHIKGKTGKAAKIKEQIGIRKAYTPKVKPADNKQVSESKEQPSTEG